MIKFKEWLKLKEMGGGGAEAIYDGKNHPDFQWSGDPESQVKLKKKTKRNKWIRKQSNQRTK